MKKLIISHPEVSLEKLKEELSATRERRRAMRVLGLIKLIEGKNKKEISQFFNCHRNTVHDWVERVNREGIAGLDEKEGRGLKGRLSLEQKNALRTEITSSPKSCGFAENIWTGKVLQEHLRKKYHLSYKKTAVYEMFHELGFTLQRPSRKLLGSKVDKQTEFRAKLKKNHLSVAR